MARSTKIYVKYGRGSTVLLLLAFGKRKYVICVFVCVNVNWFFIDSSKSNANTDVNRLSINRSQVFSRAIRTNRNALPDKRSWNDFPVVHDYLYEPEEEFDEKESRSNEQPNDFQPLCQNVRRRIELQSEIYEYSPPHYVETICRKFASSPVGELSRNTQNQMCAEPGFTCVQRTRTVYLTRKRFDSDCWESAKEVIASGCDCMWPGTTSRISRR